MSNDTSQFPPQDAGAEPTIEQAVAGAPEPAAAVEPAEAEAPRRGRPLLTLAIILVAAVVLIGLAHRYASRQVPINAGPAGEGLGQPAPDFMVKDIRGNTFKLSELKGKVVVLDFWATWCQPCKIEIPWFVDMYSRYRSQGLEVVGVAMDDEGAEVVKPFVERYRMNYKVVIGNEKITDLFGGIYGLPTTFIIDREGKIHSRHIGLVSRETLEQAVKKLL